MVWDGAQQAVKKGCARAREASHRIDRAAKSFEGQACCGKPDKHGRSVGKVYFQGGWGSCLDLGLFHTSVAWVGYIFGDTKWNESGHHFLVKLTGPQQAKPYACPSTC